MDETFIKMIEINGLLSRNDACMVISGYGMEQL